MIPIRPLLKYDWSGAVIERTGLAENDLDTVAADLDEARREVGEVDQGLFEIATGIPSSKQPLDAGFFRMPERILEEYHADQEGKQKCLILKLAVQHFICSCEGKGLPSNHFQINAFFAWNIFGAV